MSQFDVFSHDNRKELENTRNSIVLGVLAFDQTSYPHSAKNPEPITLNVKETGILMYVKPISKEPDIIWQLDNIYSDSLYVVRPKQDLGNHLPPEFKYLPTPEKQIELLYQKFKNKIIVFRPRMNYLEHRVYKNLDVINCSDEWKVDTYYETVPKITNMEVERFEEALLNGESIGLEDYGHSEYGPEYVICGDFLYQFKNLWIPSATENKQWKPNNPTAVVKALVDWTAHFVYGKETLMFLETHFLSGISANAWMSIRKISNFSHAETTFNEEVAAATSTTSAQVTKQTPSDKGVAHDEHQFLEHLMYLTRERGQYYNMETLVNFHISVKTNSVTILSGMSGTGKTRLAILYAEALGLYHSQKNQKGDEKNRLLIVPISPAYTEPEDISGHLNTSTGLFVPSDTGFIDFLIEAQKDPNNMYMVIFDEMNLSQVEHWFAPFLSRLELAEDMRELQLYSKNQVCHNKSEYPSKVHLGENLLFVGTANMDETTRSFSDRLLDRVNIVVPGKMKFQDFFEAKQQSDDDYGSDASDKFREKSVFRRWVFGGDAWNVFSKEEMEFFEKLHKMINDADPQKGVSFRSLKKIGEFIKSIPVKEDGSMYLDRREVIDLQVKQRILTKIRGTSEQFKELIGVSSDNASSSDITSLLYQHFTSEAALGISDFTLTLEEIRRKARELHMYDYAS